MGKYVRQPHSKNGQTLKSGMLDHPLEFIHQDHLREREVCVLIDKIGLGEMISDEALEEVVDFLKHDLLQHLLDEEEDLFPLLKRRCTPEDEIERLIAKLQRDHGHADEDTPAIIALLETLPDKRHEIDETEAGALADFSSNARRHLFFENAIILPFARLRLTDGDLETLRIRMCQRRGIDCLKERRHAQRPA